MTCRIELNHEALTGRRWAIACYESPVDELRWQITASAQTPVEIVSDIVSLLAAAWDARTPDAMLDGDAGRDQLIHQVLQDAGHSTRALNGLRTWTSPDGAAGLEWSRFHSLRHPAESGATAWGGSQDSSGRSAWKVTFTAFTPDPLITSVLGHLADPSPVQRHVREIPAPHRDRVRMESLSARTAAATTQARSNGRTVQPAAPALGHHTSATGQDRSR